MLAAAKTAANQKSPCAAGGESWLEMPLPQGVQHVYALACG
jgi:hypothetical protein